MPSYAVACLLALAVILPHAACVEPSSGKAPGGEVSVAFGFVSESEILTQLSSAATDNCFLGSARIGADMCTYATPLGPVPMGCIRLTHNVPMAFIEGGDRQGHLSLYTKAAAEQMGTAMNVGMAPIEKTNVQRVGDLISASVSTQGHCLNMLLIADSVKKILTIASLGSVCTPTFEITRIPYGYAFASEGDHINGTEFGNWRGIISYYWFTPWLTPFTSVARAMETAGMCPIDYYQLFCHGGWGTVYPATGTNPAESRTLGLLDSMWDSLAVTYAPFFTYGPLHVRLGTPLIVSAHSSKSYQTGMTSMYATMAKNGYVQQMYPIPWNRTRYCYNMQTPSELGAENTVGKMPAIAAKPIAETQHVAVQDTDRVASVALWPRFTCCNLCSGSIEAPARHMVVGRGFLPQLVP